MVNDPTPNTTLVSVQRAHQAFRQLEQVNSAERSQAIEAMADALEDALDDILEANTLDLVASGEMAVAPLILNWLKLTPDRLQAVVAMLRQLSKQPDPTQPLMDAPYQVSLSQTYSQLKPLGTIALIYEGFPALGAIAAGLCLKSGNSLVLRGCSVASYSNQAIAQALQVALDGAGLPAGCLEYIAPEQGDTIQALVRQDRYLSLVIPYGRPSLIQQVTQQATTPVLKPAIGNCYLYWSATVEVDLARWVILDSYKGQPDAVNAIEKVLITPNQKSTSLTRLFNSLQEHEFQLIGDATLCDEFPEHLSLVDEAQWGSAYLDRTIAFKVVADLPEAIAWINQYSSGHADCILTESYEESRQFAHGVDSALVYINTSPRFMRHVSANESVFLGMSSQKGARRGLIGLETFTTLKQVVQGTGKDET